MTLPDRRLRDRAPRDHAPLGARASRAGCTRSRRTATSTRRSATSRASGSCSSTRRTASATCTRRTRRCWSRARTSRCWSSTARRRGIVGTRMTYATHPFDVVGWDGCLYPYTFNVEDFEPITGRVHQPPPVHQVFEGWNFVVCNFCPRKVDYHPLAIPVPYYHSNVDSDEVMFYVGGDYEARKGSGINIGSISLHPGGHAHGPQPSAIEASLGAEYFEELAVMVDTFAPLDLGEGGLAAEDPAYAWTWAGRGPDASGGDSETGDRRSTRTRDPPMTAPSRRVSRDNALAGACFTLGGSLFSIGALLAQTGAELTTVNVTYLVGGVLLQPRRLDVDRRHGRPRPVAGGARWCCSSAPCCSRSAWWRPSRRGSRRASPTAGSGSPTSSAASASSLSGHLAMLDVGRRPGPRPPGRPWTGGSSRSTSSGRSCSSSRGWPRSSARPPRRRSTSAWSTGGRSRAPPASRSPGLIQLGGGLAALRRAPIAG